MLRLFVACHANEGTAMLRLENAGPSQSLAFGPPAILGGDSGRWEIDRQPAQIRLTSRGSSELLIAEIEICGICGDGKDRLVWAGVEALCSLWVRVEGGPNVFLSTGPGCERERRLHLVSPGDTPHPGGPGGVSIGSA